MPRNHTTGERVEGEAGAAVATAVRETLTRLRAGEPLRAGALTLLPLLPAAPDVTRQTGYLPLAAALEAKAFKIAEKQQESVPELHAVSTADLPVVLIGGEQVVGGLQNRVLNTTILVAAHTALDIPVTCVEAGRWHGQRVPWAQTSSAPEPGDARAFATQEVAYAKLRKAHSGYVSGSLSGAKGYRSDQGRVWNEVAQRVASTRLASPTMAMHSLYQAPERADRLGEMLAALPRPEGALGFVAMVGPEPLGAEVFTDEALASAYWEKLARSYALEALDAEPSATTPSTDATAPTDAPADVTANAAEARLIAAALAGEIQVYLSPGLGSDVRVSGPRISGAGLVYEGALVHLSLFPEDEVAAPTVAPTVAPAE